MSINDFDKKDRILSIIVIINIILVQFFVGSGYITKEELLPFCILFLSMLGFFFELAI